jgi:hypothetical protein
VVGAGGAHSRVDVGDGARKPTARIWAGGVVGCLVIRAAARRRCPRERNGSVSRPAGGLRWPARRLPMLQGVLPVSRSDVRADVVAGLAGAALGVPEVLGYAKIAGMPVVTGLYTILLPMAVFAVLGSSRHLVVGAYSATAAILAAGLAGLAAAGSPRYVALAGLVVCVPAGTPWCWENRRWLPAEAVFP